LINSKALIDICKFYILDAPDADEETKDVLNQNNLNSFKFTIFLEGSLLQ